MPVINRKTANRVHRQAYPGRLLHRTDGCWKLQLSDAGELTQFGLGEVELAPGASTGLYHWHEHEDELVYIVRGEVVMIEEDQEFTLGAGDCATFKAGAKAAHTFENRSNEPVVLLELGHRHPGGETAHYPGLDMVYRRDPESSFYFETRDGRRLTADDEVARVDDPLNLKPPSRLDID